MRRFERTVLVVTLIVAGLLLPAERADAIPAFARKYVTSCQTCHVAYPKLNAFGEAFRLRGYRMPGETEDMVKDKPVSLGAPAWKRLWPKAIWPSDIPGSVPLAMRVNLPATWDSQGEGDDRTLVQNDFKFPGVTFVQGAGTFGENFSFFTKLQITRQEDAELVGQEIRRSESVELDFEHAEIRAHSIAGPDLALNLKVGRFEPEMVGSSFSHMRPLTDRNYANLFAYGPIAVDGGSTVGAGGHGHGGLAGLAVPTTVEGIEVYGVAKHRFFWNVGVVNGLGPGAGGSSDGNSLKDVYGRLTYKFGGMGLDGTVGDGVAMPGGAKPWRDDSFKVGIFAYRGDGEDVIYTLEAHGDEHGDAGGEEHGDEGDEHGDEGEEHGDEGDEHGDEGDEHGDEGGVNPSVTPIEDESFTRYGADFHWYYKNLHLFGVYVQGEDTLRIYDPQAWADHPGTLVPHEKGTFDYETFFVEADFVFLPWLHGAFRYEYLDPANQLAQEFEWGTANLTALIRANVKAYVEVQQDLNNSKNYAVIAALDFAF
jgi:hypothetical protein